MRIGQVEHFQAAIAQSRTRHAAGPEGNQGLPLLQAFIEPDRLGSGIKEGGNAREALRVVQRRVDQNRQAGDKHGHEPEQARPAHEHDARRGQTDQGGRTEIHLHGDQTDEQSDGAERHDKPAEKTFRFVFVAVIPPREENQRGDFGQFAGLERSEPEIDPAPRAVDPHADRRHEAENEQHGGQSVKIRPEFSPPAVIGQRRAHHDGETDAEPERLAPDEVIHVAMTVAGEGARALQHDDPDGQQADHGKDEYVGRPTTHGR